MLKLPALFNLEDSKLRDYFERIERAVNSFVLLKGQWTFIELNFSSATSNKQVSHGLKFTPKDVIKTYESGAGTITFNYDLFDSKKINITTTGAVRVRFFLGRYEQ